MFNFFHNEVKGEREEEWKLRPRVRVGAEKRVRKGKRTWRMNLLV